LPSSEARRARDEVDIVGPLRVELHPAQIGSLDRLD
jgi:hypothetical protein